MSTANVLANYFPTEAAIITYRDSSSIKQETSAELIIDSKSFQYYQDKNYPYYANKIIAQDKIDISGPESHILFVEELVKKISKMNSIILADPININPIKLLRYIQAISKKAVTKNDEIIVLQDIIVHFGEIEKVKSIYFQKYRDEIQLYILINSPHYDYELMDNLFEIEYKIRKKYPDIIFQFIYPPAEITKDDFVHPQAQCIYTKT